MIKFTWKSWQVGEPNYHWILLFSKVVICLQEKYHFLHWELAWQDSTAIQNQVDGSIPCPSSQFFEFNCWASCHYEWQSKFFVLLITNVFVVIVDAVSYLYLHRLILITNLWFTFSLVLAKSNSRYGICVLIISIYPTGGKLVSSQI